MMRKLLIAVVLLSARSGWAQTADSGLPVTLGNEVRLSTSAASEPLRGIAAAIDEQALLLVTPEGPVTVPFETIDAAEVRVGRRSHPWRGAAIGAGVGLLLGFAFEVDPVLCRQDDSYFCSRGEAFAGGVVGGGVMGAAAGALIKTDRWARADLRAGMARDRAAVPTPTSGPPAPPGHAPSAPLTVAPPTEAGDRPPFLRAGDRVRLHAANVHLALFPARDAVGLGLRVAF
jgi:hypothetical protein